MKITALVPLLVLTILICGRGEGETTRTTREQRIEANQARILKLIAASRDKAGQGTGTLGATSSTVPQRSSSGEENEKTRSRREQRINENQERIAELIAESRNREAAPAAGGSSQTIATLPPHQSEKFNADATGTLRQQRIHENQERVKQLINEARRKKANDAAGMSEASSTVISPHPRKSKDTPTAPSR